MILYQIFLIIDFYDIALTYLERNVKSSGEIKNYLKKKGASDEISSKIVSALISHKLLDDKKYFELYVSHYIRDWAMGQFIL